MVSGSFPAWIQASVALGLALGGALLFLYNWFIKPMREHITSVEGVASTALDLAEDNQARVNRLDDDLGESLDDLRDAVDGMRSELEKQRRQSRGTSYQLYVLAEAINESDEAPDVPVPDEDDFLRGGGD